MSRTNEHKKVFNALLSQYFPSVWFQLCPVEDYPRVEFEFKQLAVDDIPYEKYILTLNCYDKGRSETIDEYIDNLIAGIDKSVRYSDLVYYQFYYNQDRQPLLEADKKIKRIILTFEVRVYLRSEH